MKSFAASRAIDNQAKHYCRTCHKTADIILVDGGAALKRCTKCAAVGRRVEYCSRECQIKDWKKGEPIPHKEICGKNSQEGPSRVDLEQYRATEARFRDDLIPAPSPHFQRSPALLKQMERLQQAPYYDYILDNNTAFVLNDDSERQRFIIARRRALANGDVASVSEMCAVMKPYLRLYNVSLLKMAQQLCNEFGLARLDHTVTTIRPPSKEELEQAARAIAIAGERGTKTQPMPWVPKPAPGFQPTTALARQIDFLNKPPYFDYVAFRPPPDDDIGIIFP